ncbi:mitogen-activated protein kinase kinase kinase kinase 5-like isoform X3 [Acanthaster planci]|uniref:Mitogen-activated protein kinase kinase kinase kinase n=1 Tax=Acanthaster planci TaxID=133434 RepID=A0A8B7YXR1_ACAPL|nr:mitogen-activated protein kinase kinase kinase kinase 5-like isoform X3 [Acanthaster planci]
MNSRLVQNKNPLEDFELLQRIGSGTYGDVYKAKMVADGNLAALKVIKVDPGDDVEIIQKEIAIMKECRHKNIVMYFGSYSRRDKLWIAMEYCGGGSLQDIYHMTGPLTEEQIAYVCQETLHGLNYLHTLNMMHRDIKGANILLTDDGDCKLADFGVSAQITQTTMKRKSFIGTPYWMAPEVAAVERTGGYNSQCDIWAVGITAIELAELQPPMFDLHPMRALYLMSKKNFVPPKLKEQTKWSGNFHGFLKSALTKNPKKRPLAEKLLRHPFFTDTPGLGQHLMRQLLDKAHNINSTPTYLPMDDEEEDILEVSAANARKRVPSRRTEKSRDRPQSEINAENVKYAVEITPQNSVPPKAKQEDDDMDSMGDPDYQMSSDWAPARREPPKEPARENFRRPVPRPRDPQRLPSSPPAPSNNDNDVDNRKGHETNNFSELETQYEHGKKSERLAMENATKEGPPRKTMPQSEEGPPLPPKQKSVHFREASNNNSVPTPPSSQRASPPPRVPPPVAPRPNGRAPTTNGENMDLESNSESSPPVVPPRRNRFPDFLVPKNTETGHGVVQTPQVPMGACFSKVFNECPLIVYSSTSWVHPETKDQYIIFACEEGIYTFNLNQIHEGVMDQIFPRRTTYVYVINNVMMSLTGKTPSLYQHNLLALIDKNFHRFHIPSKLGDRLQRIPDKLVPRKFAVSHKVPDTKGCTRCCIVRNPFDGHKYLCGALPNGVVLLQWYEPMNKFLQVKVFDCPLPPEIKVFEMLIKHDSEFPIVCVGVARGTDRKHLSFDLINLNTTSSWFVGHPPEDKLLDVVHISQLEKDTVLVCFDREVKVVNLNGKPKSNRKLSAELHFDFAVEDLVVLQDSVLAFHKHGMQGRSFRSNEVTQEICDKSKLFTLLGAEKLIILKSHPTDNPQAPSNIYMLTGHANTL